MKTESALLELPAIWTSLPHPVRNYPGLTRGSVGRTEQALNYVDAIRSAIVSHGWPIGVGSARSVRNEKQHLYSQHYLPGNWA
jgi:hypothetical protein